MFITLRVGEGGQPKMLLSLLFLAAVWRTTRAGCPFQNPFFFVDRPSVVTVVDSEGQMVADRVRVRGTLVCLKDSGWSNVHSPGQLGPTRELQVCGLLPDRVLRKG